MAGIPVSGPGKFSQRTDRQPIRDIPNADYGEQTAYKQLQQDAPMARQPDMPPASAMRGMDFASLFGNPADRVVPMGADSQEPNTPVTDGANFGPGADSSSLGLKAPDAQSNAQLASWLPALEFLASKPDSSIQARALVRSIKAML